MRPSILLLDRDGVILTHVDPYILSMADVNVVPGAIEVIGLALTKNIPVAVISNQSPIGRGLVAPAFVDQVNASVAAMITSGLGHLLPFYVCPHAPTDHCVCRKPKPYLLQTAAFAAGVDITRAWMVGDQECDMAAARAARCGKALLVTSGVPRQRPIDADLTVRTLSEIMPLLLETM